MFYFPPWDCKIKGSSSRIHSSNLTWWGGGGGAGGRWALSFFIFCLPALFLFQPIHRLCFFSFFTYTVSIFEITETLHRDINPRVNQSMLSFICVFVLNVFVLRSMVSYMTGIEVSLVTDFMSVKTVPTNQRWWRVCGVCVILLVIPQKTEAFHVLT